MKTKFTDIVEIFKKKSLACDGVVVVSIDDWNYIASFVNEERAVIISLVEMLQELIDNKECDVFEMTSEIESLLTEARGEVNE